MTKCLGIDPTSQIGVGISECGFDPYERDDGIHPYSGHEPNLRYNDHARANGLAAQNPWEEYANAAEGEDGDLLSGWFLKYSDRTARVPEPYASMFGPEDVPPANRSDAERENGHPVFAAFMDRRVSKSFCCDDVRAKVIPAYMGLIKQIDDQMGRLFQHLEDCGIADDTMIVFTSDHGDYLGDHLLGEKDLFHEEALRVPLIIYDPSTAADATCGTLNTDLAEAIDLAPPFLDMYGGVPVPMQRCGQGCMRHCSNGLAKRASAALWQTALLRAPISKTASARRVF